MKPRGAVAVPSWDVVAAERSARFALMQALPETGLWEWEPASDRIEVSERFRRMLGARPGQQLTLDDALAAMAPEDGAHMRHALEEMARGERDAAVVTCRLASVDGATRWLTAHCAAVRTPEEMLCKVVGITTDQTERLEAAEKLRDSSAFWQATLDSLTAHVAVLDSSGTIIALNAVWRDYARDFEGEDGEHVGDNYVELCEQSKDPLGREVAAGLRAIMAGERERAEWTYPWERPAGRRWFAMRATRFSGGGETRVVISQEDVTIRHEAVADAQMRAELLDEVDAAVIQTDMQRRVLAWSVGAERLYGWSAEEAVGRTTPELGLAPKGQGRPMEEELMSCGSWQGAVPLHHKDGTPLDAYFRMRVLYDEHGTPASLVCASVDITEQKRAARDLEAANSYLLAVTASMDEALFTVDREGRAVFLNTAAERLLGWSKEEAWGRSMHELTHAQHADGSPFPVEDCPIYAARTAGKVVRVDEDVFRRKDGTLVPVRYTASRFATAGGVEGCVVVMNDITERKREEERIAADRGKLLWLGRLREALAEGSFELYAQPIVSCATGETVQRELLLRMHHPDLVEPATPASFLSVAEEVGLVKEIDRWVIGRAIEIAAAGQPVELNLSARSITDVDIIANIESRLTKAGIDSRLLVFEITETALLEDEAAARSFVERLHRLGCGIALDDFGTGYGTFTYLKQLPIDTVKIDIEFIRDLRESSASAKVVNAVLNVARDFGLKTVAEGVEDQETFELLQRLGVDYAQGFHLGRPAPLGEAKPAARRTGASGASVRRGGAAASVPSKT